MPPAGLTREEYERKGLPGQRDCKHMGTEGCCDGGGGVVNFIVKISQFY